MQSYLQNETCRSSHGSHAYDIYNPFSSSYPKPPSFYTNPQLSQSQQPFTLTRNLRPNATFQQLKRQTMLIRQKQIQHHDILYGQNSGKILNSSRNNNSSLLLNSINKSELFQKNPFTVGQSEQLRGLKMKHLEAKQQFQQKYQKQQERKLQQIQQKNDTQLRTKQVLMQQKFQTIMELKNLEDYRKIKQAQKIKKEQYNQASQRKSLMNVADQSQNSGSILFSFNNQEAKKQGLKISSKFSRNDDTIIEKDNLRFTFNKNETSGFGNESSSGRLREVRRLISGKRQPNDSRDSLSGIRQSGGESPKTLKLKNKTYYLIAA